jgi:hypothetical protein
VSALSDHVGRLEAWLRRKDDAPPWQAVLIVESAVIKYGPRDDVPREALKTVEAYASRFDGLLAAGHAWINLSALGVLGKDLLICVELPRAPLGVPVGRTSVNLSGRPLDERTRACAWDAAAGIRLVE